ncbi:MAG: hypothetical protein AAGB35_01815 [Pseudomonadota bacterium]
MGIDNLNSAVEPEQFSSEPEPMLIALDNLDCYVISGEDSQTFLQGQLTNNVDEITSSAGQLTSYCTPKGRMLAIFYLLKWHDQFLAIIPSDISESVIKRLQMFVLRSKVEIKKLEEKSALGIYGVNDHDFKALFKLDLPIEDYQTSTGEDSICIKIPGISNRYIFIGDQLNSNKLIVYTNTYWKWLDIMSGVPSLTESTQEAFVPQMTNMELINGVSFSKGCYPGQEIVARLHYLGNANRRMFRIKSKSEQVLNAGDDVYSSGSEQSIGKLVSAVKENDQQYSGLAVIRIEAVQKNELSVHSGQGSRIEIMPLPYQVPTKLEKKAN